MLNFPCASVVILYKSSFSSNSHSWTIAPVTFTWQCIFNDTAYNVTNILLLPEATVQLTLDDNTAVHLPYRSAQVTEFALYTYYHTTPQPLINGTAYDTILSVPTFSNSIKPHRTSSVLLPPNPIVSLLCPFPLSMVVPDESHFCQNLKPSTFPLKPENSYKLILYYLRTYTFDFILNLHCRSSSSILIIFNFAY